MRVPWSSGRKQHIEAHNADRYEVKFKEERSLKMPGVEGVALSIVQNGEDTYVVLETKTKTAHICVEDWHVLALQATSGMLSLSIDSTW